MEYLFGKDKRQYVMGIAVVLVVLGHLDMFSQIFNNGNFLLHDFFKSGGVGVDVFFLASAYGLSFSVNKNTVGRFYFNRIKRLFPIYALFVILLIFVIHPEWSVLSKIKMFLYQCTGLVFFTSEEYMMEWYVSSMIVFYFVFPLFYKFLSSIKSLRSIIIVIAAVTVVSYILGKNSIMATERFAYRIPLLVLGVYSYIFRKEQNKILLLFVTFAAVGIICYTREMRDVIAVPMICLCVNQLLASFIVNINSGLYVCRGGG